MPLFFFFSELVLLLARLLTRPTDFKYDPSERPHPYPENTSRALQLEQTQGSCTRTVGLQEQQADRHNSHITICQNTSLYTHFGISADKHGRAVLWNTRELPLRYEVPAPARHRRSLALPVTPLATGSPDKPKQRMGASVWSRGAGAHQSRWLRPDCWFPQRCGSGTLCRWKTEEGEWVIMRVLAPVLPTQNSTAHKRGPLTARHVWVF